MADSYDIPKASKKSAYAEAVPVVGDYGLTDADRIKGLHSLLEACLAERQYQDVASIAALAHRYNQLAHIIYRVDDLLMHGIRRRR